MIEHESELRAELTLWSYPGWTFGVDWGSIARNSGKRVVQFRSDGITLADSRRPGQLTAFQLEAPFELPIGERQIALLVLDLVRFVILHEVGEFLTRGDERPFDPHDSENEAHLYGVLPLLWSETD